MDEFSSVGDSCRSAAHTVAQRVEKSWEPAGKQLLASLELALSADPLAAGDNAALMYRHCEGRSLDVSQSYYPGVVQVLGMTHGCSSGALSVVWLYATAVTFESFFPQNHYYWLFLIV